MRTTYDIPLGKNFLTLTTTFTLPPGVGLATPSWRPPGAAMLSLDRSDRLETLDLRFAEDAVEEMAVGAVHVLPLIVEDPDVEAFEECEPGPMRLKKRESSAISLLLLLFSLNNCTS